MFLIFYVYMFNIILFCMFLKS